jgi:signal transduction histidine kinase
VGNNDIRVEVFDNDGSSPTMPLDRPVRVSGIYEDVVNEDGSRVPGRLLVLDWKEIRSVPSSETPMVKAANDGESGNLQAAAGLRAGPAPSPISTVAEIKALSPDLAMRALPVSIRGIVTAYVSKNAGAVVQDSTRGVYVDLQALPEPEPLQLGELCQIEGVTGPGLFSPTIEARRITHLGPSQLPRPLNATWDQLVNGSLDNEYAEIEGVVTGVHDRQVALLVQGGKITLDLYGFRPESLVDCENALVRIRGCFFANFNQETHRLGLGSLSVRSAAIDVLQPAPRDLFDAPQKSISQLLLYDPKAAPLRLLKVSAQIVYGRPGEFFLTDGTNGLRVTTRNSNAFAVGDLVDAVGFLELGGPAAELKEAVLRRTGSAPLMPPAKLTPDQLLQAGNAGMLVQVEATLMNHWREDSEDMLEIQSGFLAFKARISSGRRAIHLPPSGSRLELTGVYAPQGNRAEDGTVSGFELLLPSPADILILATPPWWNLRRVLVLAGILGVLLLAVLFWNKELQRMVQMRGRQLELEIRNRQRAELQRAAEAERARIARDLHDELGTGLTEVSLLADAGLAESHGMGKEPHRFHDIAEKARALVSGLDVIVWAIDPKRNSLQSFADYLGRYATELFSASDIVCRFKIPIECDPVTMTEAARHSLFLAVKEALNNVLRHASATEVELQISQSPDLLQVVVADNGRGFDWHKIQPGDGLANLQARLEALNGQCLIESQEGKGTTVRFSVPLPGQPISPPD